MTDAHFRRILLQAVLAVLGTGVAFAFLASGAFRAWDGGTWNRMVAPEGLRAAALGAASTALLVAPLLAWEHRRAGRRRRSART